MPSSPATAIATSTGAASVDRGGARPSAAPLDLLFVDDDVELLDAVRLVIGQRHRVATATSAVEASKVTTRPHVAFVDLGLPGSDGVALVAELCRRWPEVPVVVLTIDASQRRVLAAFRAGARGYVLKADATRRLEQVIDEALEGGAPMSAAIARLVLRIAVALPESGPTEDEPLTCREIAVLRALADVGTYDQVAGALGISVNTLRAHVRSVYRKLAVGTRTDAVVAGLQLGLLARG